MMRIKPNTSASDHGRQAAVSCGKAGLCLQRGFTLVELMIVIMIVAVMATIAVPAFKKWRDSQAVNNAASTLLAHMKQARLTAMAENRSVSIAFCDGTVRDAWVLDSTSTSCDPCATSSCTENMTGFSQFSGSMTISSTLTRTFTSRGTVGPINPTITLAVGSASKTITLNAIGRAYLQ